MESIIVTITDQKKSFAYDVEIPTGKPMGSLRKDIADTLNGYESGLNLNGDSIYFICGRTQKRIKKAQTVEDAGVWNGDYLIIKEE